MPPKRIVYKARRKSQRGAQALNRLNSFLDAKYPRIARMLVTIWNDQQDAITYKELREAVENGYMSEKEFREWQQDYIRFFNNYLAPALEYACIAGSNEVAAALLSGADVYAPMATETKRWVEEHGAELVTRMSNDGKKAIASLVQYSVEGNMTVDELARAIRPTIGLTYPQAQANIRYYANVKTNLMDKNPNMKEATAEKRAHRAANRYAARQHRDRAQMIAETELAWAYNKGADNAIKQATRDGLLPKMKAVWSTAADELVCPQCGAMEGVAVDLGASFHMPDGSVVEVPPAHPRCRCAVAYEEADFFEGR